MYNELSKRSSARLKLSFELLATWPPAEAASEAISVTDHHGVQPKSAFVEDCVDFVWRLGLFSAHAKVFMYFLVGKFRLLS
jgi:hypothetical protein